jgi:hypothetical protein
MLSERGSWNPATAEAILVPLIWAGWLLLPIALRVLFAAGAGPEALQRIQPSRIAAGALLAILIVAGLVIYAGPIRAMQAANYSTRVYGKVLDAQTGAPIANARVDDNSYGAGPDRVPRQAWTDADGNYVLLTSREEHTIAASAPGYEPSMTVMLSSLFRNRTPTNINFRLSRAEIKAGIHTASVSSRKAVIQGQNLAASIITFSIGDSGNDLSCGFIHDGEFTAVVEAGSDGLLYTVQDQNGDSLLSQRIKKVGSDSVSRGSVQFFEGSVTPDETGGVTIGEFRSGSGQPKLIRVTLLSKQ